MPAITVAYLAFAAGLFLGFGGEVFPGLVVATAALALAMADRSRRWVIASLGVAGGVLLAARIAHTERACTHALAGTRALPVRLTSPAVAGHTAYGRTEGPCDLKVRFIVAPGGGSAEALVLAAGRWRERDRAPPS